MNLADDEMQMQVPFLPVNLVNLNDEEMLLDQLVDFNEVSLPEDLMEGQDDQDAGLDQARKWEHSSQCRNGANSARWARSCLC